MQRFRQMRCLQRFASVHASVSNHFNQERSLSSRNLLKLSRTAAPRDRTGSERPRDAYKARRAVAGLECK